MLHLNINDDDDDVTGGGSSDESDVETEPGLTLRRKVRMMTETGHHTNIAEQADFLKSLRHNLRYLRPFISSFC